MTQRDKDLYFEIIELLREQINLSRHSLKKADFSNTDWKDADDWLFSELNITQKELEEIYEGRNVLIYTGSAVNEKPEQQDDPAALVQSC